MTRILSILTLCALVAACAGHAPAPDRVALPPAPPRGEPANMTGLSAAALKVAYGLPAFTRKDGDTQMWRYDGAGCHAFFFLYPGSGGLSVRHVETVPRPSDAAADEACLRALRKATAPVS